MKIWHFIPYSLSKNYGKACNEYCELIQDDEDWIAIQDADCMILTPDYGHLLYKIISNHSDIGLFTCYVNRIKPNEKNLQQYIPQMFAEFDIREHREKALELYNTKRHDLKELNRVISGYFMLFQKKTWKEVGGFCEEGILKVDNKFSRAILEKGKKIMLIESMYILHYYRMLEGVNNKSHLK